MYAEIEPRVPRPVPSPVIHVGYHKAGSTWLKDHVLRPEHGFHCPPTRRSGAVAEALIIPDSWRFNARRSRAMFADDLHYAQRHGLVPVISDENLVGKMWHTGFPYGHEVAWRVRETFPDGRILIVIREQCASLYSRYQQYVKEGGTWSIEDVLNPGSWRSGFRRMYDWGLLDYASVIERYYDLFGRKAVLVLPVELLQASPGEFLSRLSAFAGVEEVPVSSNVPTNTGIGGTTVALVRAYNRLVDISNDPRKQSYRLRHRFQKKIRNAAERWAPREVQERRQARIERYISELIGDRYGESNRRTSELIGIDLAAFGYSRAGGVSGNTPEAPWAGEPPAGAVHYCPARGRRNGG